MAEQAGKMSLERIAQRLDAIHTEQVRQGVILERHEQRSTQLEERVTPIERHVAMWSGVGKAVAVLGTLAGAVAGLWRAFG